MSSHLPSLESFLEALPGVYLEPILTGLFAGVVLGFLGIYVVLRRMVFISAALSQASGVGVALAFYLQIHLGLTGLLGEPIVMALLLSLGATVLFQLDPSRLRLTRDSILGLAYVLAGGMVLILGTRIVQEAHDIRSILFGTGVAVRRLDLVLTLGVGSALLALHIFLVRGVAAVTFDPIGSQVQGLPVRTLEATLFFSIAVAVAITTRALGALPVFALTVLPAMTALAMTRRLARALMAAGILGGLAGGLGYVYAYFAKLPVGASQTAMAGTFALMAMGAVLVRNREAGPGARAGAALTLALVVALVAMPLLPSPPPPDPPVHPHAHHHHHNHYHQDVPERLLQDLKDGRWEVRAEAAEALGKVGGSESCDPLAAAAAQDKEPWVRQAAALALKGCPVEDVRRRLENIRDHDPHELVRSAAAQALGGR